MYQHHGSFHKDPYGHMRFERHAPKHSADLPPSVIKEDEEKLLFKLSKGERLTPEEKKKVVMISERRRKAKSALKKRQ